MNLSTEISPKKSTKLTRCRFSVEYASQRILKIRQKLWKSAAYL